MTPVIHLRRLLESPPDAPRVDGVRVRTYGGPSDVDRWLEIRRLAFSRERVGVRQWSRDDFEVEFLAKPWWRPDWLWLAEPIETTPQTPPETIGTVALAIRGGGETALPVIHWLAVAPRWRRRGVARLLIATLESAAWREGHREIHLETHAAWSAALGFYQSLGYREYSP